MVIRISFVLAVSMMLPALVSGQLQEADNSIEIEVDGATVKARLSSDGKSAVWAKQGHGSTGIFVSESDGSKPTKLTSISGENVTPHWLGDESRIVFCAGGRTKQIWTVDVDGENLQRLTQGPHGCRMLVGGPGGLVAWQALYERDGKVQPADVIVWVDGKQRKLVNKTFVTDMVFDQHGNHLAVGTAGREGSKLIFKDLFGNEDVEVNFHAVDERLFAHGAYKIHWSPDGDRVSCRISFLGGREGNVKIYGDQEVFVISKQGEFTAYEDLPIARESHEWIPVDGG